MYDQDDIDFAQQNLDFYPDSCKFWDSEDGQETIKISKACNLVPATTNAMRKDAYLTALHEREHDC